MFPASTRKGQAVLAFPDVCKTPVPIVGVVPIPYPNIGMQGRGTQGQKPGTKPVSGATKPSPGGSQQLRSRLSALHAQILSLGGVAPDQWHGLLDDYVMTAAELYKSLATR